jgi:hypothetical protein
MIIWARLLPYIKGAALLVAIVTGSKLYIAHVDRVARAEQKAADAAEVSRVRTEAKAADLEHARAMEAVHAQGTKEANDALLPQLEAARAALADYARRLRAQAPDGGRGGADLPNASDRADVVDGADPLPLMDDLDRCTEAVTRLKNAQDWWIKFIPSPS